MTLVIGVKFFQRDRFFLWQSPEVCLHSFCAHALNELFRWCTNHTKNKLKRVKEVSEEWSVSTCTVPRQSLNRKESFIEINTRDLKCFRFFKVETKQIPTLLPDVYIETTVYRRLLMIIFCVLCFNIFNTQGH